jgi:hypothetical protein
MLAELDGEARAIPNSQGRFWRITASCGEVSHLWGTMHSSHRAIPTHPTEVEATLRDARVLAIEADPDLDSRDEVEALYDPAATWRPWTDSNGPGQTPMTTARTLIQGSWPGSRRA